MSKILCVNNFSDSKEDGKIYGVVLGVVIDNDSANHSDKPGLGCVKVKIPLLGMQESNWARIMSFMAGSDRGAFFLPEKDDEVLVAFENGDVNRPYIIGSLWNGKDTPPETNSDGENNIRIMKSRSGHIVKFSDKKDEEQIIVNSAKGHKIILDDKKGEESIQIVDKSGSNKIVINTKDKIITVSSDKDMEFSAPNGKIAINAKNIEMKSSAQTKIEASADMTVKGATVNIN